MKIKKGYKLESRGGGWYLVSSLGDVLVELNSSSRMLCRLLLSEQEQTREALAASIVKEYGVKEPEIMGDVDDFILQLSRADALETDKINVPIKCMVWDLDRTVWEGVISESVDDKVKVKPGIKDTIVALDERGVLNSIASKNEFEDARRILEHLDLWKYFLVPQVNWMSKSENIRIIASELNIGLDSIGFVDDDVREREEVCRALPMVRCYTEDDVPLFVTKNEFQHPITEMGKCRRKMYQDEIKRKSYQKVSLLPGCEFLTSLHIVMKACNISSNAVAIRSSELLARANNWHLSGRRDLTSGALQKMAADASMIALAFYANDIFGDYGCVGVAVIKLDRESNKCILSEFAMSCRAASKSIDVAIFKVIVDKVRFLGVQSISVQYVATSRNIPLKRFLDTLPFRMCCESASVSMYVCDELDVLSRNIGWSAVKIDETERKSNELC